MSQLQFSPYQALLGGAILGAATLARLFTFGTVTGISGMLNNVMAFQTHSVRRRENLFFVSGLIVSGAVLLGKSDFSLIPESSVSIGRTVTAALLVEFGSRIQNGCTSGHGICGLSRLSVRSVAAVVFVTGMFMIAGFATSTLMHTASDLGVKSVNLSPASLDSNVVTLSEYRISIASVISLAIFTFAARKSKEHRILPYAIEFLSGFSFGSGLVIGGMTNPSKVASFLTLSSTLFDPTLMFVMAGGIAVALPGFQYVMHRHKSAPSSVSFLGREIHKSVTVINKTIDLRLAIGSVMFGTGWGLLGICPGPAFVSLATLHPRILAFGITYAASFLFFEYVQPLLPKQVLPKRA